MSYWFAKPHTLVLLSAFGRATLNAEVTLTVVGG
jgi:hypothetical protein